MDTARVIVIGLCLLCVSSYSEGDLHIFPEYHANSCNGDVYGIPCCEDGFVLGDNVGAKEKFIQAGDYKLNCANSCKSLYKNSIGTTESLKQKYTSGYGKNKNKCWCEFGNAKVDTSNKNYKTCVFADPSSPLYWGSVVEPVVEPAVEEVKKEKDHAEQRETFHYADKDGNGKLTSREAIKFVAMTGDDPSVNEATVSMSLWMPIFIDTIDENRNKMIDYEEVDWTSFDDKSEEVKKEEARDIARSAVRLYDHDANGNLNIEEFSKVIKVFIPTMTRQQASVLLTQMDKDGDGELSVTEFTALLED